MSKAYIDKTLPNLIEAIKSIISEHKNEKGIIHTHSYYIANRIKNSIHDKRILTHNSNNRDTILKKHTKSKGYTVLVSPSMTEGVDLKDDTSRFQIICKVPYPYLGDKLVKKRMNRWQWWYPLQTAKTVVQATGRSVRSNDDYATTYILDSSWGNFYKNNISLFPQDFQKCIVQV
jgi:Rad3-related DNA helicase